MCISHSPWPNSIPWNSHLARWNRYNSSSGSRSWAPGPFLQPQWSRKPWTRKIERCPVWWGFLGTERGGGGFPSASFTLVPSPQTWVCTGGWQTQAPITPREGHEGERGSRSESIWSYPSQISLNHLLFPTPTTLPAFGCNSKTWMSSLATESLSAEKKGGQL